MNSVLLETSLSFTKHFETLKKIKYENEFKYVLLILGYVNLDYHNFVVH